jgi:hypothetical protein
MRTFTLAAGLLLALTVEAGEPRTAITPDTFDRLHALILPQEGEAKWATIPWLTSLAEARERAVKEDRPLFVWRAGGGEVLGRA